MAYVMSEQINIARKICAEFGGMPKMSRAMGHRNHTTVQGWCNRGLIPLEWKTEVETAAVTSGVKIPKTWWQKMYGL